MLLSFIEALPWIQASDIHHHLTWNSSNRKPNHSSALGLLRRPDLAMAFWANATADAESIMQNFMTATVVEILRNHIWPVSKRASTANLADPQADGAYPSGYYGVSSSADGIQFPAEVVQVVFQGILQFHRPSNHVQYPWNPCFFCKGSLSSTLGAPLGRTMGLGVEYRQLESPQRDLENIFMYHLTICVFTPNLPLRQIPLGFKLVPDT